MKTIDARNANADAPNKASAQAHRESIRPQAEPLLGMPMVNNTLHEAGPVRSSSPSSGSGDEAAASAPRPEDLARQRLSRLLANPPPFFVQRKRVQGHAQAIVEAIIKLERQIASGGGEPASLTMSAHVFGEAIKALAECERALTALTKPDQEASACRP